MQEWLTRHLNRRFCVVAQEGAGVLLNLQVDGQDGDQLVQFRSLTDIWAVRKVHNLPSQRFVTILPLTRSRAPHSPFTFSLQ